jgi:hypothetical protein
VDWDSRTLIGRRGLNGPEIDVYQERGVYVLYKDFEPVYVGKADMQELGLRLQLHRQSPRKGPRWNQFSWFGIRGLRNNGKLRASNAAFHPKKMELIATMEALLIATIDPRLNSRKEKFKNAVRLYQSVENAPNGMEDLLKSIQTKLDCLIEASIVR